MNDSMKQLQQELAAMSIKTRDRTSATVGVAFGKLGMALYIAVVACMHFGFANGLAVAFAVTLISDRS